MYLKTEYTKLRDNNQTISNDTEEPLTKEKSNTLQIEVETCKKNKTSDKEVVTYIDEVRRKLTIIVSYIKR